MTINLDTLTPAHLPELTALCNAHLAHHRGLFSEALLRRRLLEDPDYREGDAAGIWEDGRLTGAAAGVARGEGEARQGWVKLIAVAEDRRGQGRGAALLKAVEGRLWGVGCRKIHLFNSSPHYLLPGLDLRYTETLCFFLKHGYRHVRDALNMEVDLKGRAFETGAQEADLKGRGILIRRLEAGDVEAFRGWMSEVWSAGWTTEAMASLKNAPVSTFVAVREGRFCGFATYDTTMFPGGFGPEGVERSLRGSGVGGVLLMRCLQDMRALGYARCEIGWVGPFAFYAKVAGARVCRVFWQMEKECQT